MKDLKLNTGVMDKLLTTIDLMGKVNVHIAKMEHPEILTFLLESVDAISSNKIEKIYTTTDEAADDLVLENKKSHYVRYRDTLKDSRRRLQSTEIIRSNDLEWINGHVRGTEGHFRKYPVVIKDKAGEIVHEGIPANEIEENIGELVQLINESWDINPIVKALLIHHRFEQIHPFSDGNGRTGRILFNLLINKYKILDIPAAVFSYSIERHKTEYYQALNLADSGEFNKYLSIMLKILNESLEITISFANELSEKIKGIKNINIIAKDKNLAKTVDVCFAGVKVSMKYIAAKAELNIKSVIKHTSKLEKLGILSKESKYTSKLEDLGILAKCPKGKFKPLKNLVVERLLSKHFS